MNETFSVIEEVDSMQGRSQLIDHFRIRFPRQQSGVAREVNPIFVVAAGLIAGKIAGDARKKLEIETGSKVVSKGNYLLEPEKEKRKQITKKK